MKAISLHQPWATMIAGGVKTIETRRWRTRHRGPLVICSSKLPAVTGHLCGYALCVVDVVGCRPMTVDDENAACCGLYDGAWAWELVNLRVLRPFAVRGRQGFFEIPDGECIRNLKGKTR